MEKKVIDKKVIDSITDEVIKADSLLTEKFWGPIIKKVVFRNGKRTKRRTHRYHRSTPLSPARRQQLRMAHRMASRTSAKIKRRRTMNKRRMFDDIEMQTSSIMCPFCEGPVEQDDYGLYCSDCGAEFMLIPSFVDDDGEDIEPDFTPSDDEESWDDWKDEDYDNLDYGLGTEDSEEDEEDSDD